MHAASNKKSKHRMQVMYAWCAVAFFSLVLVVLWGAYGKHDRGGDLQVVFFDVGQGDSIFIETPQGVQVLVDGGKGRAVLRELGKKLSFFDRTIDMVVATHPDLDHIGGLPEVLTRYHVRSYLSSDINDDGADNRALLEALDNEGAIVTTVTKPQSFLLDKDVRLDVLFPDREVSAVDVNTGSVVLRLSYGSTSFLLTGDAPSAIETYLVSLYGETLKSTVLKLGHHGSNTSSSLAFLGYVSPEYAVVSAGCDNSYGHPHREVLERLQSFEVTVFDTCTYGSITFVSDGKEVVTK